MSIAHPHAGAPGPARPPGAPCTDPFRDEVADAAGAHRVGPDYVAAVAKVINSHVRNELFGVSVFEEPAIRLARTPQEKWLALRIGMEEVGHHLRFSKLAADLGVLDDDPHPPLSVFSYDMRTWTEFVVLKAIVDTAEVLIMEDLHECTYRPLRSLCETLMPEERFHVRFGQSAAKALAADPATRPDVQAAVDGLVAATLPMFGRSRSRNNDVFRWWGIKRQTNDECRAQFVDRTRQFVEGELGLEYPEVSLQWPEPTR